MYFPLQCRRNCSCDGVCEASGMFKPAGASLHPVGGSRLGSALIMKPAGCRHNGHLPPQLTPIGHHSHPVRSVPRHTRSLATHIPIVDGRHTPHLPTIGERGPVWKYRPEFANRRHPRPSGVPCGWGE